MSRATTPANLSEQAQGCCLPCVTRKTERNVACYGIVIPLGSALLTGLMACTSCVPCMPSASFGTWLLLDCVASITSVIEGNSDTAHNAARLFATPNNPTTADFNNVQPQATEEPAYQAPAARLPTRSSLYTSVNSTASERALLLNQQQPPAYQPTYRN